MTVIPFPSCRFTPADLSAFYEVALPKCSRGAWAGVARQTERHHDRLLISLPGVGEPVFIFERDVAGHYCLWFRDGNGKRCIGKGMTASACLSIWRPAPVRRRSAAVPVC
ncbi:hypothetical protein GGE65_004966 [Skermanella aerolata]|uniref:hypothetical protein n=1 Tax=Skermanella aerolata TaxID=393310 RepID=UPI003D25815C